MKSMGFASFAIAVFATTGVNAQDAVDVARQVAVGGTAQAGASDSSAIFSNPAGLGGIERGADVTAGFGLELARFSGFPSDAGERVDSRWGATSSPIIGLGVRLDDAFVVGVGVRGRLGESRPFRFDVAGDEVTRSVGGSTLEISPALAFTIPEDVVPGKWTWGLGYRLASSWASISSEPAIAFSGQGFGTSAVSVGTQLAVLEFLRLGASFRYGTSFERNDGDAASDFSVPVSFAGGARFDLDRYGLAVDYAFTDATAGWLLSSENGPLEADDRRVSHRVGLGFEYRAPLRRAEVPLRLGYRLDTPDAGGNEASVYVGRAVTTHTISCGAGYRGREFEFHGAGFARLGSGDAGIAQATAGCVFCGEPGSLSETSFGVLVDASYRFEL